MKVDRERNCYTCGGFGHIAHHCRNQRRIMQERRIEYEEKRFKDNIEQIRHLKEVENLEALD